MKERPQTKFVEQPSHLVDKRSSVDIWQQGGMENPKDAIDFDKTHIRKTVIPAELPKQGE